MPYQHGTQQKGLVSITTGKLWLRESLRKQLAVPKSEGEKERKKEMAEHIRSGHRTKLVLNTKPCEGCIAGTSRPKYATKNKGPYISKENTINSDTVFYPGGADNNGDGEKGGMWLQEAG